MENYTDIINKNSKNIKELLSGGIMQLVCAGIETSDIKNFNDLNFSNLVVDLEFQNKNFTDIIISKNADQVELKYLMFEDKNLQINDFINIMKNSKLILAICGSPVCIYDFELMMELNPIKKIKDFFIITIPTNITLNKIKSVSLNPNSIRIIIDKFDHIFDTIKLSANFILLNEVKRKKMHDKYSEQYIQQFQHYIIEPQNNITHTEKISPNLLIKGFFIIGDIENIHNFSLSLNGYKRISLDHISLKLYSRKISNNMIFLSFDCKNKYEDLTFKSSLGSLCSSAVDDITIYFSFFKQSNKNYKFILLNNNILKYLSGMCGLKWYVSGDYNNKLYENDIPLCDIIKNFDTIDINIDTNIIEI